MTLYEFQEAFYALTRLGSAVHQQGFNPTNDCNTNALRLFRKWLEDYAGMFSDSDTHLNELQNCIDTIEVVNE